MTAFLQDIRFAWRQMVKAPGFAATVIVTLALTIGLATAVFSVIDAVILRPLPFHEADRIVAMESHSGSGGYTQPASWPSFQDERAQAKSFDALAAYWDNDKVTLEAPDGNAVSLQSVSGTDNFFSVFDVKPFLGRGFLAGEEAAGKNDIAVLSYATWQSHFNGDSGIVNKTIRLNGKPFVVVGVMPPEFRFPLNKRDVLYTPMHIDEEWMNRRGAHWLRTVGRMKDGVTIEQAQADMSHVFANLGKAYPATDEGRTVHLTPLAESVTSKSRGPLWTLLGAVLAVMAIGCVNVAGLLLARGVKREREMAMRVAIGAGRGRLLAQVLTEGLLLALLGAVGGIGLAWILLRLMRTFLIHALARGTDAQLNLSVLAAAMVATVVVSLAASLYPALRLSGLDPNSALKSGGNAGTQRGQHRLRSAFVVTQVALTLVLLVVSGLMLRVVSRYRHTDLGFEPGHILAEHIQISRVKYQNRDVIADFYRPLEERVRQLPGVRAVGVISHLPIEEWGVNSDTHIAGQPPYPKNKEMLAETRFASAGYFDVMGVTLRGGRKLSPSLDRSENIGDSVVANEAFVKKFIPDGADPTSQRLDDAPKQQDWTKIVGVVSNVRQDLYQPPMAEIDWLIDELDLKGRTDTLADMWLVVRTAGDPLMVASSLRGAMHEIDPSVPFEEPETMSQVVAETLVFERMESWLFGIFAGLALLLALVGLYGLVSHEVEQSSRDIGVRMALGATRLTILNLVLRRVALMLSVGAVAGLILTVLARKLMGVVIYFDPQKEAGNILLVAALLLIAGLIAALIPAARAASTEPVVALRSE